MDFVIKCIPSNELKNLLRLGTLSITFNNLNSQSNQIITYSTPLCLQYTKAASIPHISWDLSKWIDDDNCPVLISVANTFSMISAFDLFKDGISSFANINQDRPIFLTAEDKLLPLKSGFNGKNGILTII